jgi:hypothetical protein
MKEKKHFTEKRRTQTGSSKLAKSLITSFPHKLIEIYCSAVRARLHAQVTIYKSLQTIEQSSEGSKTRIS